LSKSNKKAEGKAKAEAKAKAEGKAKDGLPHLERWGIGGWEGRIKNTSTTLSTSNE